MEATGISPLAASGDPFPPYFILIYVSYLL